MPPKLSEAPEDTLRDFFETNIRPAEVEGYDPNQTWSTDNPPNDALVITTNWDNYGDFYPIIVVNQTDSPVLPNSGNTNYNGVQGDGSGRNQYHVDPVTVSCQAVEGRDYLNGTNPKEVARLLYAECHAQIQDNSSAVSNEFIFAGMTQPTLTKSNTEENGTSTDTWYQWQGTVDVGIIDTP